MLLLIKSQWKISSLLLLFVLLELKLSPSELNLLLPLILLDVVVIMVVVYIIKLPEFHQAVLLAIQSSANRQNVTFPKEVIKVSWPLLVSLTFRRAVSGKLLKIAQKQWQPTKLTSELWNKTRVVLTILKKKLLKSCLNWTRKWIKLTK